MSQEHATVPHAHDAPMPRGSVRRRRLVAAAAAVALFACVAPVAWASTAAAVDTRTVGIRAAGVEDFEFASFQAEYHLGRDDEGHSTLLTRETLVASFPQFDQNRGIRRAIPNHYRDIGTRLEIVSVTDEAGMPRSFTVETDGGFEVVTIAVPEGQFVHGAQTYVIEYRQRDVTAFFENTGRDEFYWDVNGTGWRQPFHQVAAELFVAPDLVAALTGDVACYQGVEGSTDRCEIVRVTEAGATYSAAANGGLGAHENLTIAVGFAPGTFAEAEPGFIQRYAPLLTAAPILVAVVLAVTVLFLSRTVWRNAPRRRAIIAQYEPPAGIDVFLAAELVGQQAKAAVASLLDLAVRNNLRLLQHEVPLHAYAGLSVGAVHVAPGAAHRSVPVFGVQALTEQQLTPAETSFAAMLFPPGLTHGAVRWFDRPDNALAERIVAWRSATARRALARRLRRRPSASSYVVVIVLGALAAVAQAVGLYALIERVERDALVIGPALLGFAGTTAVAFLLVFALRRRPLTPAGRDALDHIEGLRLFIRVAEADRLRMLQGPAGAERVSAASTPSVAMNGGVAAAAVAEAVLVVRVYERLLPYAVLFGLEREWLSILAHYYRYARPEWMVFGGHDLPLHTFADSLSGFVSSLSASYSGSDSSSGSGGSGGGGSSGGGGGGGGGGGV